MKAVFLPGFLWLPGDEAPLQEACARRGVSLTVLPLTTLADVIVDVDSDLVPCLRARTADAAVVVGYSMGARVCAAALARGFAPRAAVLASLSSTPTTAADRADRAALDAGRAAALRADPAAFVASWGRLPIFAAAAQRPAWQQQQQRRRCLSPDDAIAHARTLERFSAATLSMTPRSWTTSSPAPAVHDAPRAPVPTRLLVGSHDDDARRVALAAQPLLPSSSLTVVPDAGHVLPLEAPDALADVIADVIADVGADVIADRAGTAATTNTPASLAIDTTPPARPRPSAPGADTTRPVGR
jgi:pimeloyl-ACP methyl ester carboxylesterase